MNKPQTITWVVVADNCQAKIFRSIHFPKIEEISYLEHPDSRLHNQDLISNRPGRVAHMSKVGGNTYQPETEPKKLEAKRFAKNLADFLNTAENNNQFERLYIIAEPTFLGLLRPILNPNVKKKIIAEVAKEMTNSNQSTIESQLSKTL